MGETGLELMVANLLVARNAMWASAATTYEGHGDVFVRFLMLYTLANGRDHTGQFMPGYVW